jgi:putative nucleotidyltransferase with HDIG domain
MRPLPTSVTRLAAVVGDDDPSIAAVAEVLRQDPALVAAVLREANSAASAARDEIATIEAATTRLGMARVLAVAVMSSVADELGSSLPPYGAAAGVLYRHSVAASHVAEVVRAQATIALGAEVVTAALLHDLGTVVLAEVIERPALDAARLHHGELTSAERELADLDHAEIGALLAQTWRLPDPVVQAIAGHHRPSTFDEPLAAAVLLADAISHDLLGASLGWREEVDEVEVGLATERLGVDYGAVTDRSETRLRLFGLFDG